MAKKKITLEFDMGLVKRSVGFTVLNFLLLFFLGPIFNIQPAGLYILLAFTLSLALGAAVFLVFSRYYEGD